MNIKWRFILAGLGIGVLFAVWTLGPFVGYAVYESSKKADSSIRHQLNAALSVSDAALVKQAEKTLAASAAQQGVTVTGMRVKSVKHVDPQTTAVTVIVTTAEIGNVTLRVTFSKGLWNVSNVAQVQS